MRILQVHNAYRQYGGEDSVVAMERAALVAAGHTVELFGRTNDVDKLRSAGRLLLAPWNPFSAKEVAEKIAAFQPDVAHIHNTWFGVTPSAVAELHRHGIPTVMTTHNYRLVCANALLYRNHATCVDCVGTGPWAGIRHRCYRDSVVASAAAAATISWNRRRRTWAEGIDRFLVSTEFAKDVFLRGGIPAEKIEIMPLFVADPGPRRSPPSASRTVMFAGRIDRAKGLDTLLAAWEKASPDLELLILGDGPLRAELETVAPPGVRFAGWKDRSEVGETMLAARTLVFPSDAYEMFALTMVEGMAAQMSIIAGDVGPRREVLGSDDGALPPAGDVDAWARSLLRAEDDDWVDEVAAIARSRYEEIYSPQVGVPRLVAQYEAVIGHPGRRVDGPQAV